MSETTATEQPMPEQTAASRPVTAEVIADLQARERKGIATYCQSLHTHNGRDAMQDLYEELLDGAQYLKQAMMERPTTIDMSRPTLAAIRAVVAERERQHSIWGTQNHDPAAWMLILSEEVGEAMREANGAQFAETEGERAICRGLMRTELTQVAAMCVQIIEALS